MISPSFWRRCSLRALACLSVCVATYCTFKILHCHAACESSARIHSTDAGSQSWSNTAVDHAQVLSKVKGKSLVGTTYQPLFPYFAHLKSRAALQNGHAADSAPAQPAGAFRVIADGYVKDDSGTGVVHQAPAFGEDDFRICIENSGLPRCCIH